MDGHARSDDVVTLQSHYSLSYITRCQGPTTTGSQSRLHKWVPATHYRLNVDGSSHWPNNLVFFTQKRWHSRQSSPLLTCQSLDFRIELASGRSDAKVSVGIQKTWPSCQQTRRFML